MSTPKNLYGLNDVPILETGQGVIPLFMPHMPKRGAEYISDTLQTRWIGQGPKVDEFESRIAKRFCDSDPGIAVGSGTDALHLAYLLAGIEKDDEVIVPVFTCTATNIPLLYIGAKIIFADVEKATMNIDLDHVAELITDNTKAIVVVHYGGLPVDLAKLKRLITGRDIKIIEDSAHALGAKFNGDNIGSISDFTMFSFQAIKHISTGDGGYLSFKNRDLLEKAKELRWFGINRTQKQLGIWENDITEIGYKYQMTDISAALGLAGLEEFEQILMKRRTLFNQYLEQLRENTRLQIIGIPKKGFDHAAWLFSIHVENRRDLQNKLLENGIESNQVHYRNDRYSIFGGRKFNLPNMDACENSYLVLPLHTRMSEADVDRVTGIINGNW